MGAGGGAPGRPRAHPLLVGKGTRINTLQCSKTPGTAVALGILTATFTGTGRSWGNSNGPRTVTGRRRRETGTGPPYTQASRFKKTLEDIFRN